MDYLLLWSGENLRGMRKARIPSVPAKGLISHIDEDGRSVVPDVDAIHDALPYRYRAAFRRVWNTMSYMRYGAAYQPMNWHLSTTRGRNITTLYLQPLNKEKGLG